MTANHRIHTFAIIIAFLSALVLATNYAVARKSGGGATTGTGTHHRPYRSGCMQARVALDVDNAC